MKWPFVRRSKYEHLMGCLETKNVVIANKDNQIQIYRKLHDEYAQLNHDNLNEINRLNQELAKELNSHRETKAHEQLLFEAHDKLNQQNIGLLFELEETKEKLEYCHKIFLNTEKELRQTKEALKIAQEETRQHRMTIDFADEKEEKIKQYLIKVINYI